MLRMGKLDCSPIQRDFSIRPRGLKPGQSARRGSKWKAIRVTEHELPARSTLPPGQSHWLSRSERAARRELGPGPGFRPPPPGLAPLSGGGERESRARFCKSKAGRRSSDIIAFAEVSKHVCFNCLNSFKAPEPQRPSANDSIPRAGSDGSILQKGKLTAETGELRGPSSGTLPARSRPRPPPATLSRPRTASFLRQPRRGWGIFGRSARAAGWGRKGLGLSPRPRGAGGGAGQEPDRRLRPSRGAASS